MLVDSAFSRTCIIGVIPCLTSLLDIIETTERVASLLNIIGMRHCLASFFYLGVTHCLASLLDICVTQCLDSLLDIGVTHCLDSLIDIGVTHCLASLLDIGVNTMSGLLP